MGLRRLTSGRTSALPPTCLSPSVPPTCLTRRRRSRLLRPCPCSGANTFIGSYWVTALRAAAAMASLVKDDATAAKYRGRAAQAVKQYESICWNEVTSARSMWLLCVRACWFSPLWLCTRVARARALHQPPL